MTYLDQAYGCNFQSPNMSFLAMVVKNKNIRNNYNVQVEKEVQSNHIGKSTKIYLFIFHGQQLIQQIDNLNQ